MIDVRELLPFRTVNEVSARETILPIKPEKRKGRDRQSDDLRNLVADVLNPRKVRIVGLNDLQNVSSFTDSSSELPELSMQEGLGTLGNVVAFGLPWRDFSDFFRWGARIPSGKTLRM